MRSVGLVAVFITLAGLLLTEWGYRKRVARGTYHWLLLMGMVVFPGIAQVSSTTVLWEETKTVNACASCHVMRPFVNDLRNPESQTLAARHYQNRWIPDRQCYVCHTNYGLHGALDAKLAAARHWLRYVTGTWQEPIRHRGPYPNANCLACHAGARRFEGVSTHKALWAELTANQRACISCHGAPHPAPEARNGEELGQ